MTYRNGGINEKTFDVFFKDDHFAIRENPKSVKEEILKNIEMFTLLSDEEQEMILSVPYVFSRFEDVYLCNVKGKEYAFGRLDKYVDYQTSLELREKSRYGKCCPASIQFAINSNNDSKVIIGYIYYSDEKIIHAVYQEGNVIFDYTKNLVMRKDDYFDLTNFKVLNEVEGKEIKDDLRYLDKFKGIPLKLYLIFRDEIMKDLKKNKNILKLE